MSEEKIEKTQKEISHEYYINNKDRLQKIYKSKVNCPFCLKEVSKASLNNHLKTKNCEDRQKIRIQKMKIENSSMNLDKYFTDK